jgi:hypothetical protein
MERNSSDAMVAGLVLCGVGGAGLLAGIAAMLFSPVASITEDTDKTFTVFKVGAITAASGAGIALIGLPIALIGAKKVPHKGSPFYGPQATVLPTVSIGPTGGSLTWRW